MESDIQTATQPCPLSLTFSLKPHSPNHKLGCQKENKILKKLPIFGISDNFQKIRTFYYK